jgi:hypothetical protein
VQDVKPPATAALVAAAASAAAALVHAAAAGTHGGASELVTLFAVTAGVQALVAGAVLVAPTRASFLAAAGVNLAAVVAWGLSRTTGLPWPELLNEAEDVGTQDLAAATLGAVAALAAGVAVAAPRWALAKAAPTAFAGAACTALLAIAVPGMAARHDHESASHDHGHTGEDLAAAADGHGHGHDDTELAAGDSTGGAPAEGRAPSGPVISLDDVRLTSTQRDAAQDLIDRTVDGMAAFPDVAALEAAGYVSIGDSVTGFEHYINIGYIADDAELDPNRIESVVLTVDPDGTKTVASAMYILGFDKTMADVPDIAGELTTWHDHQNLCWEGARVVAVLDAAGNCPRGVFRATPPMLHVWLPGHEPECGPFAGIEGSHGDSCGAHGHE